MLFGFFINNSAIAQVANYTFTESSGTYTALTSPTTAIAAGWNDVVTTDTIPIGFSFGFNGTNYTTCSINSNGFITFGSTLSANTNYFPISTNTGYAGAISALGVNMWDFFLTKPITYLTTGTSPNRVFTVQWKDADRFDRGDEFNFQIQLNETTNVIKIVYGLCFPTGNNGQNINVQVGLRGATNADFNNRSLTTNNQIWDGNTSAGTLNTAACRTRGTNYPNSGRTFIWSPTLPPTITSLGSSAGCVGDIITINGTNLLTIIAANVKIGGTAVTNILTNTGTQITATIGAGTTGLVTVQNSAGTGTSAGTFTVNAVPVINTQPTAPAVICAGAIGTRTISVTTTGATSYQWRLNGVALSNFAPYSNVTTATLTITNPTLLVAGTYDVIVSNATCSRTSNAVAFLVTDVPTIATTPTPTSGATGLCYSGAGAVTSVSWAAVAGAVNYDVYFGAGSLPGVVTSANLVPTTYNTGVLSASTTYFWRVVAKNACGSALGSSTWTFTTLATACICLPSNSIGPAGGDWISIVNLGVLNNFTGPSLTFPYYTFYNTLPIPDIQRSTTQPIAVTMGWDINQYAAVWIDFNNDGIFAATEGVVSANAGSNTLIIFNIVVPAGAALGNVRMRVRGGNDSPMVTSNACTAYAAGNGRFGETEDYIVNIIAATACSTPIAPTLISLSPNNTSISGSFTLPSPAADAYLVVRSTSATPPTPASGTSYAIGSTTFGAGTLVIDNDNNNIFSTTGLTASTTYYFYVFSIKSICSSGPVYSVVLSGSTITTAATVACITATSTSKALCINSFKTVGNLTNIDNSNSGYTNSGYTDYTSLPTTTQIAGSAINLKYETSFSADFKIWVDWNNNGVFDDNAATEKVYDTNVSYTASATFGFVVPPGTAPGNYRLRIRAYQLYVGPPGPSETTTAITPCGNLSNGETEDYKITVVADCTSKITNVVDGKRCDNGVVVLSVSATAAATEFRWYDAEIGGTLIGTSLKIGATLDTDWTTPTLTTTTVYWVEAWSATCASFYREKVVATVNATSIITFNPTNPVVCGENTIIAVTATGDFEVFDLINEDFEGTAQLITVNTTTTAFEWLTKTSLYKVVGTTVWKPIINSRNQNNKFAFTTSDVGLRVAGALVSNTLNTTGFLDLTLTFRHYFSYYPSPGDKGYVQASIDGGTTWTNIFFYQSNQGEAGNFQTVSVALPSYLNQSNLKIRFNYDSTAGDGWAIDDIRLYGTKPINTTFTWGGGADAYADALATIPYNPMTMSLATVYIKPTPAQLASSSWTFTANATIANGCVVSKPITLTNNTRKWIGTTTDWNLASNWQQGSIPNINSCVIIPNNSVISGSNYNAFAKNLLVKATGNLLIQPSNNITIADDLNIESSGTLELKNSASLVQVNAVSNTVNGTFKMERITQPMYRYDYTYWGSPLKSASNFTLGNLSPLSSQSYSWTPSIANNFGNWAATSTATIMDPTKGYAVLAPNNWTQDVANKVAFTTNFIGNPNNGIVTSPITFGTLGNISDNKWNLIANPYPCAINADLFLGNALNTPLIDGTIYFWTHNTQPSTLAAQPFYGTFSQNYTVDDYASWNRLGGVGTQATPAITAPNVPNSISGGQAPNGFIAAGTGFFVKSLGVAGSVTFNNSMRVTSNNAQFFRNASSILDTDNGNNNNTADFEKHRIWLNLSNNSNAFSQTLLGYAENATNDIDRAFDGERIGGNGIGFYSMSNEIQLGIQARALPFDENQDVPMGMTILENGNYNIGILRAVEHRICNMIKIEMNES